MLCSYFLFLSCRRLNNGTKRDLLGARYPICVAWFCDRDLQTMKEACAALGGGQSPLLRFPENLDLHAGNTCVTSCSLEEEDGAFSSDSDIEVVTFSQKVSENGRWQIE